MGLMVCFEVYILFTTFSGEKVKPVQLRVAQALPLCAFNHIISTDDKPVSLTFLAFWSEIDFFFYSL